MDGKNLTLDKIPRTLYRVDYKESVTTYNTQGLNAQDMNTRYEDEDSPEFHEAVERHLNWDHNIRSIFISLFSEKEHAENWMLQKKSRYQNESYNLLEIDTTALQDSYVFRARDLVNAYHLSISEKARPSVAKEYLVVHSIPFAAIVRRQTLAEIETVRNPQFLPTPADIASEGLHQRLMELGIY